jgi:hypothetical protein
MPNQKERLNELVKHAGQMLKTKREVRDLKDNLRMLEQQRIQRVSQSDSGETEPEA